MGGVASLYDGGGRAVRAAGAVCPIRRAYRGVPHMNEGERHQLTISSTPRLTPDEVAGRVFSSSFRGISESEVRAFLGRVAEELAAARGRERELAAAINALEEQLRSPQPLDEQRMLDVLGEETTRLLRSAREAAGDIRTKAEERASVVLAEAQEAAREMREEAEAMLSVRTREVDAVKEDLLREANEQAAGVRADAERFAEENRLRVETESNIAIEAARTKGREMLEEVKSLRERVVADLGRRRALLQAQIGELRSGRDQLLEAYRVVKRTFLDATEALAKVEARAAAGRASHVPVSSEDLALVESATAAESGAEAGGGGPVEVSATPETPGEQRAGRSMADVDSLFARLREERATVDDQRADEAAAEAATTDAPAEHEPAAEADAKAAAGVPQPGGSDAGVEQDPAGPAAPEQISAREAVLRPLAEALTKPAKRAAQDEQNEILDAVRRRKGRATSETVLADVDAQLVAWLPVIGPRLGEAYAAGLVSVSGGDVDREPDAVAVSEIVRAVVSPLRERVVAAIDDMGESGAEAESLVAERIGARYREWKTQEMEGLLVDALAAAYALGAYDAAPDGALLSWVTATEGHCPDCDDNALEPTARGAEFPTGQRHPPAHPGCRCLAVPASARIGPRASA